MSSVIYRVGETVTLTGLGGLGTDVASERYHLLDVGSDMTAKTPSPADFRDAESVWLEPAPKDPSFKHRTYAKQDTNGTVKRYCHGCLHEAEVSSSEKKFFEAAKQIVAKQHIQEQKGIGMTTNANKGLIEGAMSAMTTAGEIVVGNLKAQSAAALVQTTLSVAKTKLPSGMQNALDTPLGAAAAELFMPLFCLTILETVGADLPGAAHGKNFAKLALTGVSAQKINEMIQAVQPFIGEFIAAGMGMMREQLTSEAETTRNG